jgi:radical SAM superfamily enzyme YgiQ (UPF0313 family)
MNIPAQPFRVGFIHSPDATYAETQTYGAKFMPVWAYTLAAHIPDDGTYALALHDLRFDTPDAVGAADVFLFSGVNQDCAHLLRLRDSLSRRYPAAKFVIGGPICWSFDQADSLNHLDAFDHIFVGDGEDAIEDILSALRGSRPLGRIIRAPARFDIMRSRPMHKPLMAATIHRYYGAVVEVSRGCPFLCEFCDVRVLYDNNRPHNRPIEAILADLDAVSRLGCSQVLLACDNFIGEPRWAEQVLDAIIAWRQRSGFRPSLYTWLTINLAKMDWLMVKLRKAGFDMLFIGVESFDQNSLLETAKVQNASAQMIESLRAVQGYGFIVVAGLIFGFDSDDDQTFDRTLRGLRDSALLSGDPSLLTALPGTPLYRRMSLSGRLRDVRFGLGGYKYQTNIRYLMPRAQLIAGYRRFVADYCTGAYQYGRLREFFDLLGEGKFIPAQAGAFGNLGLFLKMVVKSPLALAQLAERLWRFASRPLNIYWAFRGLLLVVTRRKHVAGGFRYFQFWFFAWTNAILKYRDISDDDFDIESVGPDFDIGAILPKGYVDGADDAVKATKQEAQRRSTVEQLRAVIDHRKSTGAG